METTLDRTKTQSVKAADVTEKCHPELGALDRMNASLFAHNEAELAEFLEQQGFKSAKDENGRLAIWRNGETTKFRFDPEGVSLADLPADIADVSRIALEATAGALTLPLWTAAIATAIPSGGSSLLAASALSAGVTFTTDIAIQLTGIANGYRDDLDYHQLALGTTLGAVLPGVGAGASRALATLAKTPAGTAALHAIEAKATEVAKVLQKELAPLVQQLKEFKGKLTSDEGIALLEAIRERASKALGEMSEQMQRWGDELGEQMGLRPAYAGPNNPSVMRMETHNPAASAGSRPPTRIVPGSKTIDTAALDSLEASIKQIRALGDDIAPKVNEIVSLAKQQRLLDITGVERQLNTAARNIKKATGGVLEAEKKQHPEKLTPRQALDHLSSVCEGAIAEGRAAVLMMARKAASKMPERQFHPRALSVSSDSRDAELSKFIKYPKPYNDGGKPLEIDIIATRELGGGANKYVKTYFIEVKKSLYTFVEANRSVLNSTLKNSPGAIIESQIGKHQAFAKANGAALEVWIDDVYDLALHQANLQKISKALEQRYGKPLVLRRSVTGTEIDINLELASRS